MIQSIKSNYIQKLNKNKIASRFSKSTLLTGLLKDETDKYKREIFKKKKIEDQIKKNNHLNIIIGSFENYFNKETISLTHNKIYEGKLATFYNIKTSGENFNPFYTQNLDMLLQNKNSYYLSMDNQNFRQKAFNKLNKIKEPSENKYKLRKKDYYKKSNILNVKKKKSTSPFNIKKISFPKIYKKLDKAQTLNQLQYSAISTSNTVNQPGSTQSKLGKAIKFVDKSEH